MWSEEIVVGTHIQISLPGPLLESSRVVRMKKPEGQKMVDDKRISSVVTGSAAAGEEHTSHSVPQLPDLANVKHGSLTQTVGSEAVATGTILSPNANNMHSLDSTKYSQSNSPFSSSKFLQPEDKKHQDEEESEIGGSCTKSTKPEIDRVANVIFHNIKPK